MPAFKLTPSRLRSAITITATLALIVTLAPVSASAQSWQDPTPTVEQTPTPTPTSTDAPSPSPTPAPSDPPPAPSPTPTPTNDSPLPPADPQNPQPPAAPERRSPRTFADEAVQAAFDAYLAGAYVPQPTVAADALRVEVLFAADVDAASRATELGATSVTPISDGLLVADVPFGSLEALQSAVDFIRVPVAINDAESAGASIPSPIDTAVTIGPRGSDVRTKTNIAAWHTAGYTGTGVKIGVIDYFDTAAWNAAVAAGEVVAPSGTFCRSNGVACNLWAGASAHGTAVSEVLLDMAPSAKLYLATAVTTADLQEVVTYFQSQGVKIITRSLATFMDGPGTGVGATDSVVDDAVSKGMAWFNMAGNGGVTIDAGGNATGGYWRQAWYDPDYNPAAGRSPGEDWLQFSDPRGEVLEREYMRVTCDYFQGLRWNDWGATATRTDYDLYAYDSSFSLIAASENDQTKGAPPIEGQSFNQIDCATYPWYYISVFRYGGATTDGDVLEIMHSGRLSSYVSDAGAVGSPISDSKNAGAASIGAVDPVAGVAIGDYSSQGPTNDGRTKPDFSAGSNVASISYPSGFNGTSAATAVAAGAAAVVLQLRPYYTPAQVVNYLKTYSVVDRGSSGADNVFGTGELRMAAVPTVVAKTVTISGTVTVGNTLTASTTAWSPSPVTLSYQWKRAGVAISGATAATYKLTTSDAGKAITVTVKGSRSGYVPVYKTSAQKTVHYLTMTPGSVTITGTAKVGSKLTANAGTWTPSTVTKTYQWKRNGVAISGATASTYTAKSADAGKVITVTVKGSKTGYTSVYKTSAGKTIAP